MATDVLHINVLVHSNTIMAWSYAKSEDGLERLYNQRCRPIPFHEPHNEDDSSIERAPHCYWSSDGHMLSTMCWGNIGFAVSLKLSR